MRTWQRSAKRFLCSELQLVNCCWYQMNVNTTHGVTEIKVLIKRYVQKYFTKSFIKVPLCFNVCVIASQLVPPYLENVFFYFYTMCPDQHVSREIYCRVCSCMLRMTGIQWEVRTCSTR